MNEHSQRCEVRTSEARTLTDEARSHYERGEQELAAGRAAEAVPALREAARLAPDHAQTRSLLGVAIAESDRDFEQARTLCESAAKQEFFNPDLYLNLARVYLYFDRRPEALRYLRRGQMIDPGHAEIGARLEELGQRRLPILSFLPRRHPINRALGTARSLLRAGFTRGRVA